VVPGRSRVRRLVSVVARCPGVLARPVTRRLLMMAGIMVAGWLLGAAGQAHADTASGARLPSAAAHAGRPMAAVASQVPLMRRVRPAVPTAEPAVRTAEAALRPSRPPAILALPPATAPVTTGVQRTRTPADTAGPSRTQRHGAPGSRTGVVGGPLSHTGTLAVTGESEKATTVRPARSAAHVPVLPRLPRPAPHRAQTLPPSVGVGVDQAGFWRTIRIGPVRPRAVLTVPAWMVPPAVRTAADEPSFSPD
jgi:hypothetical protein